MTEAEIDALGTRGWFVRVGFASARNTARVAADRTDQFRPSGLTRDGHRDASVRGDRTLWVTEDDVALAPLFADFEALRIEANRDGWLGLTRFEVQLALYGGNGEHYVRHRDSWPGSDNRRLTAISYLSEPWQAAHGGQLVLHVEPEVRVEPHLGTLVVFLSEAVEHEVLPAWAPRFAATAWFYAR